MDIYDIFDIIINILLQLVNIAFMLIFIAFFWGLGIFVKNTGDEKTLEEGKKWMLWAIIALFITTTIWGTLGFLQKSSGIPSVIIPPL